MAAVGPRRSLLYRAETERERLFRLLRHDGNTVAWYQPGVGVTGALNVSDWANQMGAAGSLVQATGANQPIYLPWTGTNYLWLPGVDANNATSPDSVAVSIIGALDMRITCALDSYAPAGVQPLIFKWSAAGNFSWLWQLTTAGFLRLVISTDGTYQAGNDVSSSVAVSAAAGAITDLRTTYDGVDKVNFYTSSDSGTTWDALGVERTITGGAIFDSTSAICIGDNLDDTTTVLSGKVYRAQIYSGIGGTLVFDADFRRVAEGATSFAEFSSNAATVTINSTGSKPAQIVGSPSLLGNGTSHYLQTGAVTIAAPYAIISVEREITWTSGDVSFDGRTANSFACQQITGTPQLKMWDGTTASASVSPTLGTYYIVTASQSAAGVATIQLNAGTAATGTLNATGLAGLTIFADGAGANFLNGQKKEVILLSEVPSAAKLLAIQQRLAALHGITL